MPATRGLWQANSGSHPDIDTNPCTSRWCGERKARPHPGLLPQGEGETVAASWQNDGHGFATAPGGDARIPSGKISPSTVPQTAKSAVSRVSKPAGCRQSGAPDKFHTQPIWKSAIQQVWKPAVRCAYQARRLDAPQALNADADDAKCAASPSRARASGVRRPARSSCARRQ